MEPHAKTVFSIQFCVFCKRIGQIRLRSWRCWCRCYSNLGCRMHSLLALQPWLPRGPPSDDANFGAFTTATAEIGPPGANAVMPSSA